MTTNRERTDRGAPRRAAAQTDERGQLERRRTEMHASEGHAGSIPRGNQEPEREIMGSHRIAWDRVLGH
jgi:hypothetical protein